MIPKPLSCRDCPLHGSGKGFSLPHGDLTHGVVLVGEALGEEEEREGRPFVGRAGKQLKRMVERLQDPSTGVGFSLDDFVLTNVIQCRPPNNVLTGASYEMEAIRHCAPLLEDTLRALKPKVIVALGSQALRRLTGQWGIESLRGYLFETTLGKVIGTYHPSYIMRGKFELSRVFQLDLLKAVLVARGKVFERQREYSLHPSPEEVEGFYQRLREDPEQPVAFDIETPYGDLDDEKDDEFIAIEDQPSYTILRISFSNREGWGITMPWMKPFPELAGKILSLPNPKVSWNGLSFDIPRLEANGVPVAGDHFDGMMMWHALEPSLPMGLKYVSTIFCPDVPAWKLSSRSNPEWYSAVDSDVTLCCFNGIRERLIQQGRWDMYLKHFVEVDKVLRAMSATGVRVNPELRRQKREEFLLKQQAVVRDVQPLVPDSVKPRKVYAYGEERLRKQGFMTPDNMAKWQVVEVEYQLKPKEEVDADGWVQKAKPPKGPSAGKRVKRGKQGELGLSVGPGCPDHDP